MTEGLHSFIQQIIVENLLCARNFSIKKKFFSMKNIYVDPAFIEFPVSLVNWQMN